MINNAFCIFFVFVFNIQADIICSAGICSKLILPAIGVLQCIDAVGYGDRKGIEPVTACGSHPKSSALVTQHEVTMEN